MRFDGFGNEVKVQGDGFYFVVFAHIELGLCGCS
jgi:hypothetical protein